jgi:predicted nucleotidyltransferase
MYRSHCALMEKIMSNLMEVLKRRKTERLLICRESSLLIITTLTQKGIKAEPFGSTIRGDVNSQSDVDILILDRNGMTRGQILVLAESVSLVTVDVLFAEDVNPSVLELIKGQIHDYRI